MTQNIEKQQIKMCIIDIYDLRNADTEFYNNWGQRFVDKENITKNR